MHTGDDAAKDSDVYRLNEGDVIKGRTEVFTLPTDVADMTRDAGLISPTVVDLASFTVEVHGSVVVVEWVTEAEAGTLGYHLFRGTSPLRPKAVRITGDLIPSQGSDGGAYAFTDDSVVGDVTFYYWLREVTGEGYTEYGPVSITVSNATNVDHFFLPLVKSE